MFAELMLPVYAKIIAAARAHGCDEILVSTYGNSSPLFPALIGWGVSLIWLSEAPDIPELDYRALRRRFGTALGLIGGIPLRVLREGSSDRITARLGEIVPPLLREGRYVPLAGGRVRDDVTWPAYRHYRRTLGALLVENGGSAGTGES
jgi:hypothetical protein